MNKVKNLQKKLSFVLIVMVFLGSVVTASAQAISTQYVSTAIPCTNISVGLRYGSRDAFTNQQVSLLQFFLNNQGYLSVSPTGYFGPMTKRAVMAFQANNGLAADGIVGVQTRAHIYAKGCTGIAVPPTPPVSAAPTIINGFAIYQGAVGQTVTLPGSGFTSNSVLHFGIGAISNFSVNSTGTAITFTIPSYMGPYCQPGNACPMYALLISNGSYPIYVENSNGKSNTVAFNVINSPSPYPVAQ